MVTIQLRRGTSAQWVAANPILANGEVGIELGPGIIPDKGKIGDGVTNWIGLPYSIDSAWIPLAEKGVAGGVATLDVTGVVPLAQIPGGAAIDAEVAAAIDAHEVDPAGHIGTSIAVVNIMGYGAVGDGVTNDYAAFAAAVAAVPAAGGTLYLPKGTYRLNSIGFITRSNIKLLGEPGTVLSVGSSSATDLVYFGAQSGSTRYSNILVEGIEFYDNDPLGHVGADESQIVSRHIDHITFRGCTFRDLGDENLDFQSCTDVLVEDCNFLGGPLASAAGGACSCSSSQYVTFRNNFFGGPAALGAAIRIESPDTGSPDDSTHVLVEGNYITARPTNGILIGVGGAGRLTSYVTVRDNTIVGCDKEGIIVAGGAGDFAHLSIVGNTIKGGGTTAATTGRGAIHCGTTAPTILIADNQIEDWGNADGHSGIVVQAGIVRGNIVKDAPDNGIYLVTGGSILVTGNKLIACGIISTNGAGIQCISSSDRNLISNNHLDACQIGIEAQSGSDQNDIFGNLVVGSIAQGIRVRGENYVHDNHIAANFVGVEVVSGTGASIRRNTFMSNTTVITNSGTATIILNNIGTGSEVSAIMRRASSGQQAPSATANTYGTPVDIIPSAGFTGFADIRHISHLTAGTFGAETLTQRLTATFSDGTTASVSKTNVTAAATTNYSNAELATLMKDGVQLTKFTWEVQSTIGSSLATSSVTIFGVNA